MLCGSRPPPGEATTCPVRCDHKASRPDATTTRLALRLTILPPGLPPNGTGRRIGRRSRVRAKEPVREAMAEIFPPDWNCPASVRQRHTGSDLGFCLRVELRTFSLDRKRSSVRQTKNPPDLRSPLTESNRRPSPYHGPPDGPCKRRRGSEQAERELTLAETSPDQPALAAFCPPKCPH